MTKKITYLLIPVYMTLSVAMAESLPSNQILLTSEQMDQVNAGLGAIVNVGATAQSSFFTTTNTHAVALVIASNPVNPALGGYVEVAGGDAVAVAVGQGASTSTTVLPATSTQGSAGTYTSQASGHVQGLGGEINVNVLYTTGSVFNPF